MLHLEHQISQFVSSVIVRYLCTRWIRGNASLMEIPEKELAETRIVGQSMLDMPAWEWPPR